MTHTQGKAVPIWWEDLQVGEVRDLGTISPTREEIIAFASQFDPQPFHLDDEAGKASVFGGLSASGWHTCSLAMRLMVTNFLHQTSSLGSPGLDSLKWLKPVYPGDVLRLQHNCPRHHHHLQQHSIIVDNHNSLVTTRFIHHGSYSSSSSSSSSTTTARCNQRSITGTHHRTRHWHTT